MTEHPLTLSEIAEQQMDALAISQFRLGAQACREMMARFVECTHPIIAQSIRLNWHPGWGDDPGKPNEIARNALGDTYERDAGRARFASRAVDHALALLDEATGTAKTARPRWCEHCGSAQ
jgi:hypothetical protein